MLRYHLHVINAVKVFDPEGVTLPDERLPPSGKP